MCLLSFPLSRVSIQGQDWVPKRYGTQGACQVHLIGSRSVALVIYPAMHLRCLACHSLFLRLVMLKPTTPPECMVVDNVATDPDCAPTFNIQEEVIVFHVSYPSRAQQKSSLTFLKHTGGDDLPWSAIFTVVTVRVSNDVRPFRKGPGEWTWHWILNPPEVVQAKVRQSCIA